MPRYRFTYNAGAPKEWTSEHEWPSDDAALHSARCRVGAIDPSVSIDLLSEGVAKRLATWVASEGKLELTPD
jgi:hypothetical protein